MSIPFGPKRKEEWNKIVEELRLRKSEFPSLLFHYFEQLATFYEHKTYDQLYCLTLCAQIEHFEDGAYQKEFAKFVNLCRKYYATDEESYQSFQKKMGGQALSVAECEAIERKSFDRVKKIQENTQFQYEKKERETKIAKEKEVDEKKRSIKRQYLIVEESSTEAGNFANKAKTCSLNVNEQLGEIQELGISIEFETAETVKSTSESAKKMLTAAKQETAGAKNAAEEAKKCAETAKNTSEKLSPVAESLGDSESLQIASQGESLAKQAVLSAQTALSYATQAASDYSIAETEIKKIAAIFVKKNEAEKTRKLAQRKAETNKKRSVFAMHFFTALVGILFLAIDYVVFYPPFDGVLSYIFGGIFLYTIIAYLGLGFVSAALNCSANGFDKFKQLDSGDTLGQIVLAGLGAGLVFWLIDLVVIDSYFWDYIFDLLEYSSIGLALLLASYYVMHDLKKNYSKLCIPLFGAILIGLSVALVNSFELDVSKNVDSQTELVAKEKIDNNISRYDEAPQDDVADTIKSQVPGYRIETRSLVEKNGFVDCAICIAENLWKWKFVSLGVLFVLIAVARKHFFVVVFVLLFLYAGATFAVYQMQDKEPEFTYYVINDFRDGNDYYAQDIGGKIWLAQNMRVVINGSFTDKNDNHFYTWEAAQKACPAGFELPSQEDFETLVNTVGDANALKSVTKWNENAVGNNAVGFTLLPTGFYSFHDEKFKRQGKMAGLWTSTEGKKGAYRFKVEAENTEIAYNDLDKRYGLAVRCVQSQVPEIQESFVDSAYVADSLAALAEQQERRAVYEKVSKTMEWEDPRNGASYKVKQYGDRLWLGSNLRYSVANSYCYDDRATNCAAYGVLYTWQAAMNACVDPWRLPHDADWGALKLLSDDGELDVWNQEYGFAAVAGGYRDENDGKYDLEEERANFWSSTEAGTKFASYWSINSDEETFSRHKYGKQGAFAVRCVMDVLGVY